jgi:type II secretory pathway pseudopilin PulG
MRPKARYKGFSLAEVLLAVGTLAIGMIFIGGTFLTGIYFSTIATEQTIAAAVADEAFAKIRLYGINPADSSLAPDRLVPFEVLTPITDDEFAYPSTNVVGEKQYFWSALCRSVDSDSTNRLVQVTVFISRKVGSTTTYPGGTTRPVPVQVAISTSGTGNQSQLMITASDQQAYVHSGCTIADNHTGLLYRVMQRDADAPNVITLDKLWYGQTTDSVWVVPPPIGGGKDPCIAVFQKLISF